MFARVLRFLLGLALLPLCVAVTRALVDLLRDLPPSPELLSPQTASLAGGYAVWLLLFLTVLRPLHAYVWAHELTHALWGVLFGARVHGIRVARDGGEVALSKTNVLISLAPYFFPFYTMIVIALRLVLGIWLDMSRWELVWLFLVGFTWGFHFTFTVQTLLIRQPDLAENGFLFSLVLIYLLNLAGIGLWVVATTPATFEGFGQHLAARAPEAYVWTCAQIAAGVAWVRSQAG
jgi:hypothetical protein